MPKKKTQETQKEQSKRFKEAVQELTDAGELNPIEAEERFERAITNVTSKSSDTDP